MKKFLFLLILLMISCSSTKIDSSWCEPNKEIKINDLNKVLVVALFNNETSHQNAAVQKGFILKEKRFNLTIAVFTILNQAIILHLKLYS